MPPQDMHSTAVEAIMFSPCLVVCPNVCPVVPCRPQGGRVHYTHAAAEASSDRERSLDF